MELDVSVPYLGVTARYKVIPDQNYIYHAQLLEYDGSTDINPPPSTLVLVKGVRRWLGSFDHQGFLNELGNIIEVKMQSEDFISQNTSRAAAYNDQ